MNFYLFNFVGNSASSWINPLVSFSSMILGAFLAFRLNSKLDENKTNNETKNTIKLELLDSQIKL